MKTKQFSILGMLLLIMMSFPSNGVAQEEQASTNMIEVIDFQSTNRCFTCNSIETNTKYTLETYFADELKNGKITFQVINVDEEKNLKMAEIFEASGTSLFLNVIVNGEDTHINLTNFAFMKGRKQKEFSEELKVKIETELKKL
ncbi:MAG: nitrophenyl compound nitroreductase subunit ArsF family protein [Melioribacteraceae bacterium]|jgi:phosphoketolase|nr:nitrophenyl compound nitroreductase subunit ArsF family protein [Melioribacteraceae bacterium]